MTHPTPEDDVKAIRDALAAGPTPGEWHWHGDPVKGDPIGRIRYEVTTTGKTITRVYYSSHEGGPTNAEADATYIAAANPARIARLLAHIDAQALRLEAAERDANLWGYLRRHWWNCRFSWNNADASLRSLTLTIRADHTSGGASEIEREVLAAIASEAGK